MSRDGGRKRDAEGEEPGDTETGELKGSSSCSCLKEEAESGMYTLVNQEFFNGAVILLFPDLLEEFARYVKADLVILPSSVEELICLIRTKNMNYGRLRGIVRTINGTCVGINEKLSDNLYLYRRGEKRIEIISEEHVTTGSDMPEREKIVRYSPNGVKMDHASERENAGMEFE